MNWLPANYSIVELFRDAAVLATAFVGFWSINAWRRETVGRRRIELAEHILAAFYQLRDIVPYLRSPAWFGSDVDDRPTGEHETPEQQHLLNLAHVLFKRMHEKRELLAELNALQWRAEAMFGETAKRPFDLANDALSRLRVAGRMLVSCARNNQTEPDGWRRYEETIWDTGTDAAPDEISGLITSAIAQAESLYAPIIQKR